MKNTFHTAPNPQAADHLFAFLERLPRDDWPFVLLRFHSAVRSESAQASEVVAWLLRDVESALRDFETRAPQSVDADTVAALTSLREAINRHPQEAAALACYACYIENTMALHRSVREARAQ